MEIRIAGEDRGHHEVLQRIAARRLAAAIPWIEDVEIAWTFERVSDAPRRAREGRRGFGVIFGFFDGKSGGPDAHLIRCQLSVWAAEGWPFDAAIIGRDTDRARDDSGARQALQARPPVVPVALAYAVPEIEAWIIAGFAAKTSDEQSRYRECCERLGFDPSTQPERLTSTVRESERDAKRVCAQLCASVVAVHDRCLDVDEAEWRKRALHSGGAAFLDDLDAIVVPFLRRRSK